MAEAEAEVEALSSSEVKSKTQNRNGLITESDMEAAQQLMQLSDEDNNDSVAGKRSRRSSSVEEEVDQRKKSDITLAIIQEIFGKDDEVFTPKKRRRYRSLGNIYMTTTPINTGITGERTRKKEEAKD